MGSTPIFSIPFADPTDLVRDWPALSEDVALAIEAALEDISVPQKRIEAFTGDGTWTVPAGVTYAIAHMYGGGGGTGNNGLGSDGSSSSVAFASGTVSAPGATKSLTPGGNKNVIDAVAGAANTGENAQFAIGDVSDRAGGSFGGAAKAQTLVAGAPVTPAATISVTVGAGGAAGTDGAAGGSGYVFIEFFEEV